AHRDGVLRQDEHVGDEIAGAGGLRLVVTARTGVGLGARYPREARPESRVGRAGCPAAVRTGAAGAVADVEVGHEEPPPRGDDRGEGHPEDVGLREVHGQGRRVVDAGRTAAELHGPAWRDGRQERRYGDYREPCHEMFPPGCVIASGCISRAGPTRRSSLQGTMTIPKSDGTPFVLDERYVHFASPRPVSQGGTARSGAG